jgi:hypothetical protein
MQPGPDPDKMAMWTALAARGLTKAQAAREAGTCYNAATLAAQRYGLTFRRAPRKDGTPRPPYGDVKRAVVAGINAGMTAKQVAQTSGFCPKTVANTYSLLRGPQ